jgi:protein-histidine pros-kinase
MDGLTAAALAAALLAAVAAAGAFAAYLLLARGVTVVARTALDSQPSSRPWTALEQMGRALVDQRTVQARALLEAELRREMMESSLDPVISVDARGHVVDFNLAAEATFGRRRAEAVGQAVGRLFDPESLITAQRRAFADFLATPQDLRTGHKVTATGRRADGTTFPIELAVTVLHGDDGPLFCASLRDISDRVDAIEARRESLAKSRFLAAMSHELRTPLNSILGFAQLLEHEQFGILNGRQKRYVTNIRASGAHLLELINEVLDLAKVQSGRVSFEPRWVDAVPIIEEVCAEAEPLARAKQIIFDQDVAGAEVMVYADAVRLRQVLTNLVGNAIKFTDASGHVRVALHSEDHAGTIQIDIEDTGAGIPAEHIDRVFEEFVQLESGDRRASLGTGLGLPLSRHLMQMMGGSVTAASEMGRGSVFSVHVPTRMLRKVETGDVAV